MKKLLVAGLLVLSLVAVPLTVMAAAPVSGPGAYCGLSGVTLTDQEKADYLDAFKKMMNLKKEAIEKAVKSGTITKAQGDLALQRIDARIKYRQDNGTVFGGGGMRGGRGGMNGTGRGMGAGLGNCPLATAN